MHSTVERQVDRSEHTLLAYEVKLVRVKSTAFIFHLFSMQLTTATAILMRKAVLTEHLIKRNFAWKKITVYDS